MAQSAYETNVQPYLDQIPEWYKTMTVRQIAAKLGVSKTALYNYAKKYPELEAALSAAKVSLVDDLKNSIKRRALGYDWDEVQTTENFNEYGESTGKTVKTTRRHVPPDLGSAHLLLKNLDDNWHDADQITIRQREKELQIKQQKADAAEW